MASSPGGVEVGRVSIRAVPDTSRLFEEFKADLKEIESRLSMDIHASVDAAELTASAKEAVAEAQALAGDIDVKARVDSSQLGSLNNALRDTESGVTGLLSGFSFLGAGAGILGTALVPLTAVVAGLAAALAAPLAISAGGLTVFGFLAGFAVKDVLAQRKAIQTLETKLSGLQKGTQDYADTLAQLRVAQSAMTPAQAAFSAALDKVKAAFHNFPQGVLLKPLTNAMLLLASVLPDLKPIIQAVSGVLTDLIGQLDKASQSQGFKTFVNAFAHQLGPDLRAFAAIAGNIFTGLFGLFGAFNKQLSGSVLKGLVNITGKFAAFGKTAADNKGLKAFIGYVKQNMAPVGQLIGGVFSLLSKALAALAPVGTLVVSALAGIVTQLNKLSGIAGPLAGALAIFGVGSFFGGPEVGLAAAAVVTLVSAFAQLYQHSKPLRNIIGDLGDFFREKLLPQIQNASKLLLPAFQSAIKDISDTIRQNKGLFEVLGKAILALGSAVVIGAIGQLAVGIRGLGKAFKVGTEAVKFFANVSLEEFKLILGGLKILVQLVLAQFGVIVDAASASFGWLPKIGPKINAAKDNFHAFADGVVGGIDAASGTMDGLLKQINAVGNAHPRFRVDSNTLDEIAKMHELDRLQIKDKHFTITAAIETSLERVRGPGGGIGMPGDLNSGSGGGGTGSGSNRSQSKPGINIQNMYARDLSDIERQSNNVSRQRAGGGVSLVGGGL